MVLYKNCSDLPVHNFFMVIKTKDFSFLSKDWDEYGESLEITEEMTKRWREIYNEYCKLTNDTKTLTYYELFLEVAYFKTRHEVVNKLIKQLVVGKMNKERIKLYFTEINKWSFSVNAEKDALTELEKVKKGLKLSLNKIRLKENEMDALKMTDDDMEEVSFINQLVSLERASGRNEINPKTTSVEKFVAITKDVVEMQQQKAKAYGRK